MKNEIQDYLNKVQWSTMTILADKFKMTHYAVSLALDEIKKEQDVRTYDHEIVHV